jgi:hypothetical protein
MEDAEVAGFVTTVTTPPGLQHRLNRSWDDRYHCRRDTAYQAVPAPRHARLKNPIQSYGVKDCSLHGAISNATTARLLLQKAGARGAPELLSRASTYAT